MTSFLPPFSVAMAAPKNARMRLKEVCDTHGWAMSYVGEAHSGPPHALRFCVAVEARSLDGDVHLRGSAQEAHTLHDAHEAACEAALRAVLAGPDLKEAALAGAWLLKLLVALEGVPAGLNALDMAETVLRVGGALDGGLVTLEARVGDAALAQAERLKALLRPVLDAARPGLADAIQAEVARHA